MLWGRVGALGGALILFFLLGRITAPSGSSSELATLRTKTAQQASTIDTLNAEIQAANAAQATPTPVPSPDIAPSPAPSPSPTGRTTPTSYTVKAGDTPGGIAQAVYGRSSAALVALILSANNVTDAKLLKVGQVLTIPPQSPASALPSPAPSPVASPRASPSPAASPKK